MEYFKKKPKTRICLILLFFIEALVLVISGWQKTGQMAGLLEMIAGVILLLIALAIYNKPYEEPKKKR
jgi:uncharacterized membrane protein